MPDFSYLATVIVPIYNSEKFLKNCIDSIICQTADLSKIQVLMINDGSTDTSETICKNYCKKYDNFFFISKENEGLSKTRNRGLKEAEGKYIFYLDSDDSLRKDTIKSVTDFFDTVYDEVDLVTYRITQYYNGRPKLVHYRYKTLIKSGVYDLNLPENAFITQTNINICVKNRGEKNILFDFTENFKHEDEKYCCDVLSEKMKIGFCADGEYIYNRNNENSIASSSFSPDIVFDAATEFYEKLFSRYAYKVPPYFQGIVFNDLRWKFKEEKLYPTKYNDAELGSAHKRIAALLERIDTDIIIKHPTVTAEHIHYWLNLKPNCSPAALTFPKSVCVFADGTRILNEHSFKAKVKDGKAVIKSPVFTYLNKSQYSVEFDCGDKKIMVDSFDNYSDGVLNFPEFKLPDVIPQNSKAYLIINLQRYKLDLIK